MMYIAEQKGGKSSQLQGKGGKGEGGGKRSRRECSEHVYICEYMMCSELRRNRDDLMSKRV